MHGIHTTFRGPQISSGSCRQSYRVEARRNPRKELFWALLSMPGAAHVFLSGSVRRALRKVQFPLGLVA